MMLRCSASRPNGVAEGQGVSPRPTRIGRGTAISSSVSGSADSPNRHDVVQSERQRDGLATLRSPVEGVSATGNHDWRRIDKPGKVVTAPDRLAALPASSDMVAPPGKLAWVIASVGTVLSVAATV